MKTYRKLFFQKSWYEVGEQVFSEVFLQGREGKSSFRCRTSSVENELTAAGVLRSTNSLFEELVTYTGEIQISGELIILARNGLREPKACRKLLQRDNYNGVSDQNVTKVLKEPKFPPKYWY